MTPEGKVKKKITAYLKTLAPDMWYDMPVPIGYGKSTLDYLCCYQGRFFSIEAKRPGGKPTPLQENLMRAIRAAGGTSFVISDDETLEDFKRWVARCDVSN